MPKAESRMTTWVLLPALLVLAGTTFGAAQKAAAPKPSEGAHFSVFEASIPEMQAAMKSGRTTSHEIVQQYLNRIATYEDLLHAAIAEIGRAHV